MKTKILLLLLALPMLLAGCKKETAPKKNGMPSFPEGTIPVVFHVLYDDPGSSVQYPAASVFRKRIEQINKFYAATLFSGVGSQKVKVTFMLATHDPQGNEMSEPGVNRVQYSGASNMSAADFLSTKRTLQTRDRAVLWDPNQYVNVWLFGFLVSDDPDRDESNVTGISYLPYCTTAQPLSMLVTWDGAITQQPYYMHGVTLNNRYFLPTANVGDDEGMFTFCHEMGHYLGLHHVFSEPTAGETACDDPDHASDDGCSDTPKYDRTTYEQLLYSNTLPYNAYYRQPCDGGALFLSTNVMDYFFSRRTNLTAQQRDRIEHVIAYSPWIPRSAEATKALLENFTGEITDERPEPILMY